MLLACAPTDPPNIKPVKNTPPKILPSVQIQNDTFYYTLNYPDTALCTLSVEDSTDSLLSITWPGEFYQINQGLGIKKIFFNYQANSLGVFVNNLIIADTQHSIILPVKITSVFTNDFSKKKFWQTYDDSFIVKPSGGHVVFGDINAVGISNEILAGMRSEFRVAGDFDFSVDLEIENFKNDVDLVLLISISENSFWNISSEGECGVRFTGNSDRRPFMSQYDFSDLSYSALSYQQFSKGTLNIKRTGDQLSISCYDSLMQELVETKSGSVSTEPVYIHLKFKAPFNYQDYSNCKWSNFVLRKGSLNFDK